MSFRQMEQDVVARFSGEVIARFYQLYERGTPTQYVVGTALSGQDHDLADYLYSAKGRFALIEFKANEAAVITELDKPARKRLLQLCRVDRSMLARSQLIHHFAWECLVEREMGPLGWQHDAIVEVTRYIPTLAKHALVDVRGMRPRHWRSGEFIDSYLMGATAGTTAPRFRRYLEELYSLAGKDGASAFGRFQGSIFVVVEGQAGETEIRTMRFTSFEHLMDLTIGHQRMRNRQHEGLTRDSERSQEYGGMSP